MATNVLVTKNNNENSASILRRFVRKVRNAGFTRIVRGKRYYSRTDSSLRRKQGALVRLKKTAEYEEMYKLGKIG